MLQAETLVQCPFNSDHRMPEAALEDHTQVCRLVRKGYTREEAVSIYTYMHVYIISSGHPNPSRSQTECYTLKNSFVTIKCIIHLSVVSSQSMK